MLVDIYNLQSLPPDVVVSIFRVKFPVGFFPQKLYKFCCLLIILTRFDHANQLMGPKNKTTREFNLLYNLQRLGQQHDGGFMSHYSYPTTYKHAEWSCRWLTQLHYTQTSYEWKSTTTTFNREASHIWELEFLSAARWMISLSLIWIVELGWKFTFSALPLLLNWRM